MKKKSPIVEVSQKPAKRRAKKAKARAAYTPPIVQANIQLLRMQGKNITQIANELGIARDTARKFLDTPAQRAQVDEVRSKILGMLSHAVDRIHTEVIDPLSRSGPALAMKALENCDVFPNAREIPAAPAAEGELSQLERDVQNMTQRLVACALHKNRVYGLPDQEVLKEPETRWLDRK